VAGSWVKALALKHGMMTTQGVGNMSDTKTWMREFHLTKEGERILKIVEEMEKKKRDVNGK